MTPPPQPGLIAYLTQHPLFNTPTILTDPSLATFKLRSFHDGDILYQPGDTPSHVYLITQGSFRFEFTTSHGQEVFVEHVTPGFIIGELEVLSELGYQSLAIAKQPTEVIAIPKHTLLHLLDTYPDFSRKFTKQLATNFFLYQALSAERERATLKTKIANSLLSLGLRFGRQIEQGIVLTISHNELSNMINASRQRVSMQLKTWERLGTLRCDYGEIVIYDMDALRSCSHGLGKMINEQRIHPYTP